MGRGGIKLGGYLEKVPSPLQARLLFRCGSQWLGLYKWRNERESVERQVDLPPDDI